jgi:hypothetical protein
MSNAGQTAQQIRNAFYRAADMPVNVPVKLPGRNKGWGLQPSGARERALGLAKQMRSLYLANLADAHVCQAWAQVEGYATIKMLRIAR